MELNEKLLQLRKQKGLTQEALADALFVSRTAISKWESGRGYPNIDSLKAIAQFRCPLGHGYYWRYFAQRRIGADLRFYVGSGGGSKPPPYFLWLKIGEELW